MRRWSVWLIADQKNPGAETGPTGPDRPGLPAVQQIACKKQEPRMKAEHHHDLKIHVWRGELKRLEGPCDNKAQSRLSQNSVAFRRNSQRENDCNSAPASGLCDAGLDTSIAVSISGEHRSSLSDLSKSVCRRPFAFPATPNPASRQGAQVERMPNRLPRHRSTALSLAGVNPASGSDGSGSVRGSSPMATGEMSGSGTNFSRPSAGSSGPALTLTRTNSA